MRTLRRFRSLDQAIYFLNEKMKSVFKPYQPESFYDLRNYDIRRWCDIVELAEFTNPRHIIRFADWHVELIEIIAITCSFFYVKPVFLSEIAEDQSGHIKKFINGVKVTDENMICHLGILARHLVSTESFPDGDNRANFYYYHEYTKQIKNVIPNRSNFFEEIHSTGESYPCMPNHGGLRVDFDFVKSLKHNPNTVFFYWFK